MCATHRDCSIIGDRSVLLAVLAKMGAIKETETKTSDQVVEELQARETTMTVG